MDIKKAVVFTLLMPSLTMAKSLEDMVRDYEIDNGFFDSFGDEFSYVNSNMLKGGEIKMEIKRDEVSSFGNELSLLDSQIENARFKSLFYTAGIGEDIVGYDHYRGVGVVDDETSTSPIKSYVGGFGIKMDSGRCLSFVKVYKVNGSEDELGKIKSYKITGITDFIDVRDVLETNSFYEFSNNVSCSFYNSFKDYKSASTSLVLEYKAEHIEVDR